MAYSVPLRIVKIEGPGLDHFWVEVEEMKGKWEWVGNLHKLTDGKVEACPAGHPCERFDGPYPAIDYIRKSTGNI